MNEDKNLIIDKLKDRLMSKLVSKLHLSNIFEYIYAIRKMIAWKKLTDQKNMYLTWKLENLSLIKKKQIYLNKMKSLYQSRLHAQTFFIFRKTGKLNRALDISNNYLNNRASLC